MVIMLSETLMPSPVVSIVSRLIVPVFSFHESSSSSVGVVIVTVLSLSSHSTSSPSISLTARTGTSVLPSSITGAVSNEYVSSFFVMSVLPIVMLIVLDFFFAVMVCESPSHLTIAPNASKMARIGTITLSSIISGCTSKSIVFPSYITFMLSFFAITHPLPRAAISETRVMALTIFLFIFRCSFPVSLVSL